MATAFLAHVLLQKMLPVTPEDIRQVHEYLKAVFCREYFAGDFCIKPWLWGNGVGSSKNHDGNIESHAQKSKVVANMPSPVPCLSPCSANARPTAAPETARSVTQFCPHTAHAMHAESMRPVCQFHATACGPTCCDVWYPNVVHQSHEASVEPVCPWNHAGRCGRHHPRPINPTDWESGPLPPQMPVEDAGESSRILVEDAISMSSLAHCSKLPRTNPTACSVKGIMTMFICPGPS